MTGPAQPRARRRRRGPLPETRATLRALRAEIHKARSRRVELLDERLFPTLCRLMAAAEHYAATRPKAKAFRFEGTGYRWVSTNLGRLIVTDDDGRPLVGSGPGLMWETPADDLRA